MNERLKKLRKILDLTQQEFGKRIGVKGNTVAQYELGRNEPIGSVFNLICREFNVNEEWLRTGQGEMFITLSRDERIACFIGDIQSVKDVTFKKRFIAMLAGLEESDWEVLEKMAIKLHNGKD